MPFIPAFTDLLKAHKINLPTLQTVQRPFAAIAATLNLFLSAPAYASGFALSEQSVQNVGTAASQGAAGVDDITTIYTNPAGLMRLPDGNAVLGGSFLILSNISFDNQGSFIVPGLPISGGEGGNAGGASFIPTLYSAFELSDRARAGIGITTPFGLSTKYDEDWVGRYQALDSELQTININPTIAYQLSDDFSIGAGVNIQYAEADLSNAIDFGGILASQGAPGAQPQALDGTAEISGSDWSLGYNLGVIYEPSDSTRIGLAYRSSINHTLRGNADFTVPDAANAITAGGLFTDTSATAELNLPDTIALGINQELSPDLDLSADVTWTNWSDFQELRIDYDSAQPDTVVPENWNDTFRLSAGLTYAIDDTWTIRGGVAYDPSPVPQEFITARIPDSDRTWVSLGVSYEPTDNLTLDLAYTHVFVAERGVNITDEAGGTLVGEYGGGVDIIGAQVNYRF